MSPSSSPLTSWTMYANSAPAWPSSLQEKCCWKAHRTRRCSDWKARYGPALWPAMTSCVGLNPKCTWSAPTLWADSMRSVFSHRPRPAKASNLFPRDWRTSTSLTFPATPEIRPSTGTAEDICHVNVLGILHIRASLPDEERLHLRLLLRMACVLVSYCGLRELRRSRHLQRQDSAQRPFCPEHQ